MNAKVFLDTNIIIYSYSFNEPKKQTTARELISKSNSYISTQVLTELCNTITKKLKLDYSVALTAIDECCANNILIVNTQEIIGEATRIAERYGYSFYDSLIISAGCQKLYSEDLQHNQIINKTLVIINPFISRVG